MIEVSITLRDEDFSITEKFLEYESFLVSHDDPKLQNLIQQVIDKSAKTLVDPDIMVKIKFPW